MRIVVLGAGALGSLIGGIMARKNDVTLVGRAPHMSAIEANGLKFVGAMRGTVRVRAIHRASLAEPPELLLVTVKAHDTAKALRDAAGLIEGGTTVLSLQNGITTVDELAEHVPRRNLIAGWTSHGATLEGPGIVRHAGNGDTILGELNGSESPRVRRIAQAFSESGITAGVSKDIRRELWLKGIVNSAINPLTALANCNNGRVASDEWLSDIAKSVCSEGAAAAAAEGRSIGAKEALQRTMRVARQTARNRSSMLIDVEVGRKTEVDYLNGAIVGIAAKHGLEAPVNRALASLVKAIECRRHHAGMAQGN